MIEKIITLGAALFLSFNICATSHQNSTESSPIPVVVIGGGCAGLGAAFVTSEYGYETVIFMGPMKGGDLNVKTQVGNWLGVKNTYGEDIMPQVIKQAGSFGAQMIESEITSVDFKSKPFKLKDSEGNTYYAHKIIIATGTTERKLSIPGAAENRDKIYYNWDVHKNFSEFQSQVKNKKVAVIGGGTDAIKKAFYAERASADEVKVFVRSNQMKISSWRKRFIKVMRRIKIVYNSDVEKIEKTPHGVRLNIKGGGSYDADVIVASIGRVPKSSMFHFIELDKKGFIKVNPRTYQTSISGVYACGDVTEESGPQPQALIAVGNGMKTGYIILEELEKMNLAPSSDFFNRSRFKNNNWSFRGGFFKQER